MGHSYGAVVCLEAAAHHPGLRSLVLYEPPVHPDQKQDAVGRGQELLDVGDREAFLDLFLTEVAGGTDDEVAVLRAIPEGVGAAVGRRAQRNLHQGGRRAAGPQLATGEIPDRSGTDTAAGRRPHALPAVRHADDIHGAIPHAEVAVLDGQRHFAPAFDPSGFAKTVLAFTAAHG